MHFVFAIEILGQLAQRHAVSNRNRRYVYVAFASTVRQGALYKLTSHRIGMVRTTMSVPVWPAASRK